MKKGVLSDFVRLINLDNPTTFIVESRVCLVKFFDFGSELGCGGLKGQRLQL